MLKLLIVCLMCTIYIQHAECNSDFENDNETSKYYVAAVIELNAPGGKYTNPQEIVNANLIEFLKWIRTAGEREVDILVFPESSFNNNGLKKREDLESIAIELPTNENDFDYIACDYSSNEILHQLSEAVANASMYVLVNIVEKEKCNKSQECSGVNLYNTNIVFDRNGCIVSRYRKFNLFGEKHKKTPEPSIVTFDTDFDVTFGHFVCFDLLFKMPSYDMINSNISHILFPSNWFSETPFLTSVQIQHSYAYANNIVLLSAGANFPARASTGSGIFVGRHGAIESLISYRNESKMMVAKIPKDINDEFYTPTESNSEPYSPIEMDSLDLWKNPPKFTYPLQEFLTIHHGDLECNFTVNFTQLSKSGYSYRFTAFHGLRNYANVTNGGEVYCSIVACVKEDDVKSCGTKFASRQNLVPSVLFHSIRVEAKIHVNGKSEDFFLMMPTSLNFNINPLNVSNFEFNRENGMKFEMKSLKPLSNLMTFGIFGRDFSIDTKESEILLDEVPLSTLKFDISHEKIEIEQTDANVDYDIALKMTIYVCLMVVLCIIAAFLVYRRLKKPYEHPVIAMRRKSEMNFSPN